MTVNDKTLALENRDSAYQAGLKAIRNYEDYGSTLQITAVGLAATSAGLWTVMEMFFANEPVNNGEE